MLSTQYRYIQCYVKRVKRVCYVHNIDTFNAMSKESKDYVATRVVWLESPKSQLSKTFYGLKIS